MSYQPLKNEDSLSELISSINDFSIIAKNLKKAGDNPDSFGLWLHKCAEVNRRCLYFYLLESKKNFSGKEWEVCKNTVPELSKRKGGLHEYLL